jgi:integrase
VTTSPETVAPILGHTSIRTTADEYLHTDPSLVAEHMAALGGE